MRKLDLFFILLLLQWPLQSNAQVSTAYTFSQSNTAYTPVSGGSVIAAPTGTATFDTDGWTVSLPFSFNFNGTNYSSIYVNSNGGATFGTTNTGSSLISSSSGYAGALSVMNRDLWAMFGTTGTWTSGSTTISDITNFTGIDVGKNIVGSGIPTGTTVSAFSTAAGTITISAATTSSQTNAAVRWQSGTVKSLVTGTAPNRTFIIEWNNFADYNTSSNNTALNFQIHLEETTHKISYHYGSCSSGVSTSRTNQVGLRGATNSDYNNRSSSTTWSATTAGTSNSASVTRTNIILPASGLKFTWTPSLCSTLAPGQTLSSPTSSVCYNDTVTFSLSNPGTNSLGVTYQWQQSNDNQNWTNITGATQSTLSTLVTAQYYRCMLGCSFSSDTASSTPVSVNYVNNVLSTTPGSRCGIGTVNLTASGSTGATLQWYSNPTGGAPLGTGSPFTSPSLNTTTTFYVSAETSAPGIATIGTGTLNNSTTGYPTPFGNYYGGAHDQYLITADELNASGLGPGNITSLAFDLFTAYSYDDLSSFKIMIAPTSLTALSTGSIVSSNFTTVLPAATYSPPSATGWATLTFATPFVWDGSSNIVIDVSFINCSSCAVATCATDWSNNGRVRQTATPYVSAHSLYADDDCTVNTLAPDFLNVNEDTYSQRPNMRLNGSLICSSPRVPVVATVTPSPAFTISAGQTVCNNGIATIAVTSNTADFTSYTWAPAPGLYTNAAATTAYVSGSSATTVYARTSTAGSNTFTVSANNSSTTCAAIATATIVTLPAAATAIGSPSALCESGTATLSLNPSGGYGAAQFQWQSSANNSTFADISGASTASYTTPNLTTTTYYRATVKNSNGTTCFNSTSDTTRVYHPTITGTTPASRCGPGTVTLNAVAADGTAKWFTAATGGTSVGSGNSFTTPSISATTTYYVASEAVPALQFTVGTPSTTVGTATGENALTPLSQYYEGTRSQYLIRASDLIASGMEAGNLSALSFNVSTKNSTFPYTAYTIKLATTTDTALTGFIAPSFNTVYGPAAYTSVSGDNNFTFSSPFAWNGSSNIVVDVCFANDPGSSGTFYSENDIVQATTKTYNATYGIYEDNSSLCGATSSSNVSTSTKIPVFKFSQASCVNTRTPVVATVNPLPAITVSPASPVATCAGDSATLTATGGGNYQWRNTSGNIQGATNAIFKTPTAGTYKVVVTTPATGCTDSSAAIVVNVVPKPTVNLGNDTAFCSGSTLTLNAGNSGSTFLWDNAATTQSRDVSSSGTYYVRVTNSSGCFQYDTINVSVNPTPVVNLGSDTTLCGGINYVLNAANAGATYLWDNASTAQSRTVTGSGTYYVRVTNSFGCIGRDTVTTTFLPAPVVNLGNDVGVCEGTTVTLNAGNPGNNTYLWDNGSTQQTRTVSGSGTYYVTVSNAAQACKGSDTINVTVNPNPIVMLGNDTTFCHSNTLVLDAGNPGATYQWNNGVNTSQTQPVSESGTYSVVVTDNNGCIGEDAINIVVTEPASGNINAIYGDTATYTFNVLNPQNVTQFGWNFGDGSPTETGYQVQHTYQNNGTYTVSLTLEGVCGEFITKTRTVEVFDATGGSGIVKVEDSKGLLLYPNPAKDLVILESKEGLKMKQITAFNVLGQMVIDVKAEHEDRHQLATDKLASGIYTIRIETDKGIVQRKFELIK